MRCQYSSYSCCWHRLVLFLCGMDSKAKPPATFERIRLADLRQGRRGKHHELVMPIVDEIADLRDGDAILIPASTFDIPLANLRSALTKAGVTRGLKIGTYSEGGALYAWRKTSKTREFERAGKRPAKKVR